MERKLEEFEMKMKRGEELGQQWRVSRSLRASHTRGRRLELDERRKETEKEAVERAIALHKDIEKHAQLREEAKLEELKRLNRKNEQTREKSEKERLRQMSLMKEKEAKLKEKEQVKEEMISKQSEKKTYELAHRSEQLEKRFRAQRERYQLVQALQMRRNQMILSEFAQDSRPKAWQSVERQLECLRKESEEEKRKIEIRMKQRADEAYRRLAAESSRNAL